jgi:hypothetical protein
MMSSARRSNPPTPLNPPDPIRTTSLVPATLVDVQPVILRLTPQDDTFVLLSFRTK